MVNQGKAWKSEARNDVLELILVGYIVEVQFEFCIFFIFQLYGSLLLLIIIAC